MNVNLPAGDALPEVFKDMARVIGQDDTFAVLKAVGGQRLRIPATEDSEIFRNIAAVVGEEKTRLLCKAFGRTEIYFPKLARIERELRNAAIRCRFDELSKGMSSRRAIAAMVSEFGLSDRQIETIVNS